MMPRTEASKYLVELQQFFTSHNNRGWENCPNCASLGADCKSELQIIQDLLQECDSTAEAFDAYRRQYGQSHCSLCTCLVLLKAIETVLPDEDVPAWMDSPNEDLGGHTPVDLIHEGHFEPVFDALWRMDPSSAGLAS